jgi:hypothetical protein
VRFSFVVFVAFSLSVMGSPAFGCSCVQPPPGLNTAQQLAEWAAKSKEAIFEGKVNSVELRWKLVEALPGNLVAADIEQEPPEMEVSFEVLRSYRGAQDKHVKVRTGLGGGDCGFDFETNKKYLVFAYKDDSGELSTSICSSTALLEESQSNLAYLRREPETPERNQKKLATDRGALCGHLVLDNPARANEGQILLFRIGDKSLVPSDEIEPESDGSFCARDLRPAKYILVFRGGPDESPDLFAFYPGVIKPSEAAEVEVAPRQTVSHLLFKVPSRQTYTVGGKISAFNKSTRQVEPKVMLLSAADRFLLALGYSADVAADGAFVLHQVLPGRYWAVVTVDSDGTTKWSTRKVEVNVDGDVSDLNLELFAN